MTFDHSRRLLFGAFAFSLLLHLVAISGWGWARPLPAAAAAPPRPALLAMVAARPAAPPSLPEKPQRARAPAPAPVVARPPLKPPAPLAVRHPSARSAPAETTPLPSDSAPVAAAAAPALPPVSAAGPPAAVSAPAESVSADGLRQYRIDLAVAARRFRMYPAVARARGWEGVAEVSIAVSAGPAEPDLRLARSSGHAVLDEQALQMLARALASTPLPESLRGRRFVLAVPVRFSLEE